MELTDLLLLALAALMSVVGQDDRWAVKERVEPP